MPLSFHETENHNGQEKEESPLGGDQMEPVEGGGNRVELDPSIDPFDLHDDGAGDVASEADDGGKDVPSADQEEGRGGGLGDQAP